jgi:putative phosphoribosyl transferase
MMYTDRMHAGQVMAKMLEREKVPCDVVVSLMRGAVPLSIMIAEHLNAELVLLPIKKIGPLENEEFAIACISESTITNNPSVLIPAKDPMLIEALGEKVVSERKRINQMKSYIKDHLGSPGKKLFDYSRLSRKNIVIVDDGIATGTSMLCAIAECRKYGPLQVSVTSPVCSKESYELITDKDIDLHCPFIPQEFYAVGQFYERFSQVSEDEIISALRGFIQRKNGKRAKV